MFCISEVLSAEILSVYQLPRDFSCSVEAPTFYAEQAGELDRLQKQVPERLRDATHENISNSRRCFIEPDKEQRSGAMLPEKPSRRAIIPKKAVAWSLWSQKSLAWSLWSQKSRGVEPMLPEKPQRGAYGPRKAVAWSLWSQKSRGVEPMLPEKPWRGVVIHLCFQ